MKVHDSGMPAQSYWESLFDIEAILEWMDCRGKTETVVEVGCGYGSFTLPVAKTLKGELIAFDIEQDMLDATQQAVKKAGLSNISFHLRDVLSEGTGMVENSVERVMLFNILHFRGGHRLLAEVARILSSGGEVDIIHWRKDIPTPRGPQLESRPDTESILEAINGTGLIPKADAVILPPYHWGIQLTKEALNNS